MTEKMQYDRWLSYLLEDAALHDELVRIKENPDEIYERFYQDLEFGTAGLRGILGAGSNRMNIYTVRKATQGMAEYILAQFGANSAVAISYDSRINSELFAREAARVMAANGVKAYVYPRLMPTPALSFAVRDLACQGGIMITASHNPSQYNGYKAYGPDGCQMTEAAAAAVLQRASATDIFDGAKVMDFQKALEEKKIEYIPQEVIDRFLDAVYAESFRKNICTESPIRVVYTPLNGAGNECVRAILDRIGVKDIIPVKEQEEPDGNFPTCPYPNPEIKEALQKGLELSEKVRPDLLLATDPDCDRVGIAVLHQGEYRLLSGNDVGVLLTNYVAQTRKELGLMPQNPIVVKTIVTTPLIDKLGEHYGFTVTDTLTGFKYIGEQILHLEQKGEASRYIFGFEESYGYLSGSYVRDKDAVNASMLICEMSAYYKKQGKTLLDVLEGLYETFGVYLNTQKSVGFEGAAGMKKMEDLMRALRENPPKEIAQKPVAWISDYLSSEKKTKEKTEKILLPKSNVLEFGLESGGKIIVRPSGTEPKIKIYFLLTEKNHEQAAAFEKTARASILAQMKITE